jgi:hypothetical protein
MNFRCFLLPGKNRCAKCKRDKRGCRFPRGQGSKTQLATLADENPMALLADENPLALTPRPREPSVRPTRPAPPEPSGSGSRSYGIGSRSYGVAPPTAGKSLLNFSKSYPHTPSCQAEFKAEIDTVREAVRLSQLGLPPANLASLRKTRDRLTVHLAADLREMRYVLDKYNLTSQSLTAVLDELRGLEEGDEEAESSGSGSGSDSEGSASGSDPDEVE